MEPDSNTYMVTVYKNSVITKFFTERCARNFFFTGELVWLLFMDCLFEAGLAYL